MGNITHATCGGLIRTAKSGGVTIKTKNKVKKRKTKVLQAFKLCRVSAVELKCQTCQIKLQIKALPGSVGFGVRLLFGGSWVRVRNHAFYFPIKKYPGEVGTLESLGRWRVWGAEEVGTLERFQIRF